MNTRPILKIFLAAAWLASLGGAAPAGTFADAVLQSRDTCDDAASANSAFARVREAFPLHTQKLKKDLVSGPGRPQAHEFFMKGNRAGMESALNERWIGSIEGLLGAGSCTGIRAAAARTAKGSGPDASRARLDLYSDLVHLHHAIETLEGVSVPFAQASLRRMPGASPVTAECRASGLAAKLEALAPRHDAARESVRRAASENVPLDFETVRNLEKELRPLVRQALVFALRAAGCEEVVYAVRSHHHNGHFYESIGYFGPDGRYLYSREGGRLSVWNLKTDTVRDLVADDKEGAVRDPCVSFDGRKILFSWRKSGSHYYHLYTVNVDGAGLTQLTDGEWNDIEPIWTPDGGIVFGSTRCHRWIPCNMAEVTNLHRCDADGRNIRMISSNVETETSPWMMPDGRIAYMRWEYTEKDRAVFHNLWTVNPDGTSHQLLFGNEYHLWDVWNDPKPVPGTDQVVFIAHNHGGAEHKGHVGVVDQLGGPNDHRRINYLTRPYNSVAVPWRDPYPVTRDLILAARGNALVVIDQDGHETQLHRLPQENLLLHEPRNLRPEPRPRRLPSRIDLSKDTGEFVVADVYHGRHMAGVQRGDVKDILIIEELPKAVHHDGHTEPLMYNGTFMLERVLGRVPVEEDGSAYFEAPPLRSLMFVLRDKDGMSVKRMQSFATLMPGERAGCIGCHEARTEVSAGTVYLKALERPPSKIEPFPGIPEVYSYPRDIQPVLDKYCVSCHDEDKREGGVVLNGDMELWFTQSYVALHARDLVGVGARALKAGLGPREVGSSASGLIKLMRGGHHGVEASPEDIQKVALWVDSAGVWAGTYAAVNTTHPANIRWDKVLGAVIKERCGGCHIAEGYGIDKHVLLRTDSPNFGPDTNEKYGSRFNLTDVKRSLLLRAPLAKAAGGLALCKDKQGNAKIVFENAADPDYQKMLQRLGEVREAALPHRHDRPGFRPLPTYAREMKRQGLLPQAFDIANDPWDPYDLDRRFWESFWHKPLRTARPEAPQEQRPLAGGQ